MSKYVLYRTRLLPVGVTVAFYRYIHSFIALLITAGGVDCEFSQAVEEGHRLDFKDGTPCTIGGTFGFRVQFSCSDHINTLWIILDQCTEFTSPLRLFFIDFEKAFDRVSREYIYIALHRRSILKELIPLIRATYDGEKKP